MIGFIDDDESRSPLDTLVRRGARKMLQAASESEVQEFLEQHSSRVDDQGRRQVVRNGYLPLREIVTGAGPLKFAQTPVRDTYADVTQRVRFSSSGSRSNCHRNATPRADVTFPGSIMPTSGRTAFRRMSAWRTRPSPRSPSGHPHPPERPPQQ